MEELFVKPFPMFFFPLMPKARASRRAAKKLYTAAVVRSREPVFYASLSVPDTFTGRFEMIALHAGLIINRVRNEGKAGHLLAQSIFDEMFLNMEIACRQVGIGDLSVPKQIKKMMKALQGRALTYDEAAKADKLAEALLKNLYATVETPSAPVLDTMNAYVRHCMDSLQSQNFTDLYTGEISFPVLPKGDIHVEISQVA